MREDWLEDGFKDCGDGADDSDRCYTGREKRKRRRSFDFKKCYTCCTCVCVCVLMGGADKVLIGLVAAAAFNADVRTPF